MFNNSIFSFICQIVIYQFSSLLLILHFLYGREASNLNVILALALSVTRRHLVTRRMIRRRTWIGICCFIFAYALALGMVHAGHANRLVILADVLEFNQIRIANFAFFDLSQDIFSWRQLSEFTGEVVTYLFGQPEIIVSFIFVFFDSLSYEVILFGASNGHGIVILIKFINVVCLCLQIFNIVN